MGGVEGPSDLPGHGGGQTEAERAKPALPGALQKPKTTRERSGFGSREGHHQEFFSITAATGPAAMNASWASGEARCNGSARMPAGARWNAFGSGSGAGEGGTPGAAISLEGGHASGSRESASYPEMSLTY
jgi:hypothetical protein